MKQELVHLTTQDITKAEVVTDSVIISEEFKKDHFNVLQDIRKHIDDGVPYFNDLKFQSVKYKDKKGEMRPKYRLNFNQFIFLVMGYTGKKAQKIKVAYIDAFDFMRHELTLRLDNRYKGIITRKDITDTIKTHILEKEEVPKEKHAIYYTSYSKLAFKIVTGLQPSKYKQKHKIPSNKNPRNYLSDDETKEIQNVEKKMCSHIEVYSDQGYDRKEIYQELKEVFSKYEFKYINKK